jgi:RNA polymerase sigma-70 factor, ECF subfamily
VKPVEWRAHETALPLTISSSRPAPLDIPLDREDGPAAAPTSVTDDVLLLFDACAPAVRRYVRSCGVAPDVADDIVQETFVALFQHLRKGGGRENLRGWVMQVGYRLALKRRRTEARRGRWQGPWDAQAESVPDPDAGPEEACVAREDRRRLRGALRALPERDRQCLHLRAEGLRYRDIAAVLGISLGAVAKSLTRAVGRLAAVSRR